MPDVLICDRDRSLAGSVEKFLTRHGYAVHVSDLGSRGIHQILAEPCGVVVLGVYADDAEGIEMIQVVHQIDRNLPVVAVGDRESLEMERQVRMAKVFYYTVLPVDFDEVREAVSRALQRQKDTGRASR